MPPGAIRALIEQGRLPARAVRLDDGPMYLIEETRLRPLLGAAAEPASPVHVERSADPTSPLEQALASVNAALDRLRAEREVAAEPRAAVPARSGERTASGLSEAGLRRLAEQIERLMAPAAPSTRRTAGEQRDVPRSPWWRRLLGR